MDITTAKGEQATLRVLLRAIEKGVMMSRPVTENCRYDLVMDADGKLSRVQVKYAGASSKATSGSFQVKVSSIGHNKKRKKYTAAEVDFIAAYSPQTNKVYMLPAVLWDGQSVLTLRYERPKNNIADYIDAKLWEW
jgi:hypothetical protein